MQIVACKKVPSDSLGKRTKYGEDPIIRCAKTPAGAVLVEGQAALAQSLLVVPKCPGRQSEDNRHHKKPERYAGVSVPFL